MLPRTVLPTQQSAKNHNIPASVGGINALQSLAGMPPQDCITCHNLMPSEYGMRLRSGYTEWAYTDALNGYPINTLIGFQGQESVLQDRLWAVTQEGIWDITTFADTPIAPVVDFRLVSPQPSATKLASAGFGTFVEITNDADERFLQYADEGFGLWQYQESGDAWLLTGTGQSDIDFTTSDPTLTLEPEDIVFVTTWKSRLWYITYGSGVAWYLEPSAISGAAEVFIFGSKLRHGGDLLAIYSWTIDGGKGIDDMLVAVGRGGDILVYQGYDPVNVATFELKGSWFLGEFPNSRKVAIDYGGEMYLLSTYGVMSLRDLMQGVDAGTTATTPSAKINRFLRPIVEAGKTKKNWALQIFPGDGFLQIIAPYTESRSAIQYNQNLITRAWGLWEGVPVNCAVTWAGKYIIAGIDGRVWEYTGNTDGGVLPTPLAVVPVIAQNGDSIVSESGLDIIISEAGEPNPDILGTAINFDVITAFQAPGGDFSSNKRVGFVRPITIEATPSNLNTKAIYDYAINTVVQAPSNVVSDSDKWQDTPPTGYGAEWNTAKWDFILTTNSRTVGSLGMGNTIAIAMRGSAASRITFVGWDMSITSGGFF
jgi:hypothetical protein